MAPFSKENFTKEGAKANLKKFATEAKVTIKKRWWVMLIEFVALAAPLIADLLSKHYVVPFLLNQPGQEYKLIPGVLHLVYSENTGAGFGMLSGNTTFLIVVTFVVIVALLVFLILAQKQNEWLRVSLLLILGGGIGNLVDRLGLGYVRDFIQYAFIKNFAICNVADAFVTVGAVMLVIVLIVMLVKEARKNQKEFEKEQAGKEPEEVQDPLDAPINLNPMLSSPNDYTFEEPAQAAPASSDEGEDEESAQYAAEPQGDAALQDDNAPQCAQEEQSQDCADKTEQGEDSSSDAPDETEAD